MIAFVLASVYGGAAGVLYAGLIHYIAPETFSIADMFLLLAMVIIGGRQSLAGCVIGAIGLTVVQQELVNLAAYAQLGYGPRGRRWSWCSPRPGWSGSRAGSPPGYRRGAAPGPRHVPGALPAAAARPPLLRLRRCCSRYPAWSSGSAGSRRSPASR